MKKKFFILVLALAMLLTACTSTNVATGDNDPSTNPSTDPVGSIADTSNDPDDIGDNDLSTNDTDSAESTHEWRILNWGDQLEFPSGKVLDLDFLEEEVVDGYAVDLIAYDDERAIILVGYTTVWLATTDGSLECISGDQVVLDHNVAYDTLYWYNLDEQVWSFDWQVEDAEPTLFYEGAIGVSHFDDESEGAIVSSDQANWSGYGGVPIYSPYGVVVG